MRLGPTEVNQYDIKEAKCRSCSTNCRRFWCKINLWIFTNISSI